MNEPRPAPGSDSPAQSLADRAFAFMPIAGIALAVFVFYAIGAWMRKTPWIFTDEAEWTQISRAIQETGHSTRRGEPIFFKSLYAVVIAPFWGIQSTATAYAAIKYANVVLMTLAAVPTYLLARMLLPKRTSLVVALLAICIPGMAYVTSIVPEVAGYPWYAVCSWLIVRALTTRRPLDYTWVALASVVAVLVRAPQFATVPASFLIAAGLLWFTGPRGKAVRAGRSRGEKLGVIVLLIGAFILFNRIFLQHVFEWQQVTQYWKDRMVDLGLRAGLAFTIGMGILPVVGGIASLGLVERRKDPAYRAFAAYLAASIFCIALYTGVKAAYVSTVFSTLVEERNMIYLSPLMLIGTALVLEAKQIDWRIVAAASAFVGYLLLGKPYQLSFPYFEAPGLAIVTIPFRHWGWTVGDLKVLLLGVLAISLLLLAMRRFRGVTAVAAVFCCAWMLTSEIATTIALNNASDRFRTNLPVNLDWVDRQSGGRPVTYLGQGILDPNTMLLTEFWNRSVKHVYSLDGSAPGPGPAGTPEVDSPDGMLSRMPEDTEFVLTDNGVRLQGPVVEKWGLLTLYRKDGPWRLHDAEQQVYADRWAPEWSSYTYFKPGERGVLEVTLSRTAYNGSAPPGHAKVIVSTVRIVPNGGGPVQGRVLILRRTLVRNGLQETLKFPIARTPVRVEVFIEPTFRASEGDPRNLGAQVAFEFIPAPKE